ncbi:MAG: NAD(P)-dependent alcohol dehydrogenase [Pseudomonadota bacterium]
MQAAVYDRYGPPDVLQLATLDDPVPAPDAVLIRIRAAAVAAEDCLFRRGRPLAARLATGPVRPRVPVLGSSLAGDIVAVGAAVRRFRPGQRVFAASDSGFGAHAGAVCLPADGALAPLPARLDYAEAVSLCAGGLTALPFLRDAGRIRRGQRVLVIGASGSVGTAAVQLAVHFGAEVTGVCSTAHLELVLALGAERAIDYTREDCTRTAKRYDIVFDTAGKSSFARCRGVLRRGGVYLATVLTPAILLQTLWTRIPGGRRARIMFTGLRPAADKARDLAFLGALADAGAYRPVIDRLYPLERIVEAHRYVEQGHKQGNVIVLPAHAGA